MYWGYSINFFVIREKNVQGFFLLDIVVSAIILEL